MTAYDIITKKKRGSELTDNEISQMVNGYLDGSVEDYQMSAFLMAVCFIGMTAKETAALTKIMMDSGETYSPSSELGHICVDKHSTGGVGDKTTLIVAPICAACGVYVPKMSGRGLGHTGGTIDKLESIPGFRTALSHEEFINTVKNAGFSVSCQTGSLVPADKKIYALRNATATVDSIPLISSSIMSKKLATGADAIVLDVKCGDGAFMKNARDAEALAQSMIDSGKMLGRSCVAVITDMNKPLGRTVGNAVEVWEAINALKGDCPDDLYEVSITLAAQMLSAAEKGSEQECRAMAEEAVSSGKAFEAFRKMVGLQGGDTSFTENCDRLISAKIQREVCSPADGYISSISCEKTGLLSLSLGAGRTSKDGNIDPTAGIVFYHTCGNHVRKGEPLGMLLTSTQCDMQEAERKFIELFSFCEEAPLIASPIIKIIK